jgi:hypothetical protein
MMLMKNKLRDLVWKRTILVVRPRLVGDISANFWEKKDVA